MADRLGLVHAEADTRIGRAVNRIYKKVTTDVGINLTRTVLASPQSTTIGSRSVTFTGMEKITRVHMLVGSNHKTLKEISLLQMREQGTVTTSDQPKSWAVLSVAGTSVTIIIDATPETSYTIYADGSSTVSTLSGSQVPVIPESFHDILVTGVLIDEFQRMSNRQDSADCRAEFEQRMEKLRYHLAKSAYQEIYTDSTGALSEQQTMFGGSGGGQGGLEILTGTWTPDLFAVSGSGITFSTATGYYNKIGSMVFFSGYLVVTSLGTASGALTVTGLPFTVQNVTGIWQPVPVAWTSSTSLIGVYLFPILNTTTATLGTWTAASATSFTGMTAANLGATGTLRFSGFYQAAS